MNYLLKYFLFIFFLIKWKEKNNYNICNENNNKYVIYLINYRNWIITVFIESPSYQKSFNEIKTFKI